MGVAVSLARPPRWLVPPWSWAGLPLLIATVALPVALFVGLRHARTGVLVGGVTAAALVLLGWSAHYHLTRPDAPLVVLDQRAWSLFRDQIPTGRRVRGGLGGAVVGT